MGVGGSLDNETAGGIHTLIKNDGSMNGFAVDKYGSKYLEHPDSGLTFDEQIPDIEGLKKLSLHIGSQIFLARLIGLDVSYDKNGKYRAIELNTKSQTTRFSQYGGVPFFGEFTDEVIDYCKEQKEGNI
jgi:D-alanine-D-alanine ligase-like ATP-grasp enzyme